MPERQMTFTETRWKPPVKPEPEPMVKYDEENPTVWEEFERIAKDLIERGFDHYGAKAIFEIIRYQTAIRTNEPMFKLNNNYTAYYARKFIKAYPQHKDFFETRTNRHDN